MKHIILSLGLGCLFSVGLIACSKSENVSETYNSQMAKTTEEYYQSDFSIVEHDANSGVAQAQTVYGLMHFRGVGGKLEENPKKGLEWLQKAVNQNEPEAIYQLGQLYIPPSPLNVVAPNLDTAHELLYKSANMNNTNAQYFLGLGALFGAHGFKRDLNEAKRWFEKAAENGHEMAKMQLKTINIVGD